MAKTEKGHGNAVRDTNIPLHALPKDTANELAGFFDVFCITECQADGV